MISWAAPEVITVCALSLAARRSIAGALWRQTSAAAVAAALNGAVHGAGFAQVTLGTGTRNAMVSDLATKASACPWARPWTTIVATA